MTICGQRLSASRRVSIVDFEPLLKGKLREQLLDHDKFVQFALTDWTLEWYNGVDFASERLYELGQVA